MNIQLHWKQKPALAAAGSSAVDGGLASTTIFWVIRGQSNAALLLTSSGDTSASNTALEVIFVITSKDLITAHFFTVPAINAPPVRGEFKRLPGWCRKARPCPPTLVELRQRRGSSVSADTNEKHVFQPPRARPRRPSLINATKIYASSCVPN